MNRLRSATSPYLLQHADNPVHWWPWGPEAFAEARRRDVPVLISVGYAACHWCHVMAHESFEDDAIAALLNDSVVSIKVDREERPDVDAVYMAATQAMTGHGGWPMTVFATPDGQPFFCGTYFPPQHFAALIRAVAKAWREQRADVLAQGAQVVEAIAQTQGVGLPRVEGSVSAEVLTAARGRLVEAYDPTYGGFGGAPKFPPHMALLFLLRHHQRTGDPQALEIARHTCEAMARGGLYDQLGGGFARYSVDAQWIVPHFEKMLYDNALLLRVYTLLWRLTGDRLALRIATETARFLMRDLYDGHAFVSSLDADTEGQEGLTYVWTPAQLTAALGEEDGRFAADLFGVTDAGTFEHGTSVLRLARDVDDADEAVRARWVEVRAALWRHRQERPQPGRDDKVVAAWCGLAITGLVEYALTMTSTDVDETAAATAAEAARLAQAAATFLVDVHIAGGRMRRVSRAGVVGEPVGVLDDYGCVAEALCAVHQLTGEGEWLEMAGALIDTAVSRFGTGTGGFYDTADDAERLITRPADPTDNATPSGLSSLAAALVSYAALTGDLGYRQIAERALETVTGLMVRHPRHAGYACAVAEALLSGPYEIAIVAPDGASPLAAVARRHAPPGAVVVVGRPDQPGVPLLASRPAVDGQTTAYVCRGFVCDRPVTTETDLLALLGVQ
ncbi:MAG: thioredoxin domain-containing protein [Micromonosporaceae bacterium]|nr:thioredoxin domain-containing protein [Micromonosporaceae bacterium]